MFCSFSLAMEAEKLLHQKKQPRKTKRKNKQEEKMRKSQIFQAIPRF